MTDTELLTMFMVRPRNRLEIPLSGAQLYRAFERLSRAGFILDRIDQGGSPTWALRETK